MKAKSVSFSLPMVPPVLADTKTETRRLVKWPISSPTHHISVNESEHGPIMDWCPYGKPGDLLWVREPWRTLKKYDDLRPSKLPMYAPLLYLAGGAESDAPGGEEWGRYRHARFMPFAFSRLMLRIVWVRSERLQDISEADAIAEGVEPVMAPTYRTVPARKWKNYLGRAYCDGMNLNSAKESFQTLWEHLNGPGSWDANPWVWVVQFKREE